MNRQEKALIIFDMDGVLTQHSSSWQYVHDRIGVNNKRNYDLFRKKELSYEEFLESDVRLWMKKMGCIRKDMIIEILNEIPLRANLKDALETLRGYDPVMAIVSGGISWLSDRINKIFRFDYTLVNSLNTDSDGVIQPRGEAVVDPLRKDLAVKTLQKDLGIDSNQTISVGDSVHDISMFSQSGFSVGFNYTEEEVMRSCTTSLKSNNLKDLTRLIENQCLNGA